MINCEQFTFFIQDSFVYSNGKTIVITKYDSEILKKLDCIYFAQNYLFYCPQKKVMCLF